MEATTVISDGELFVTVPAKLDPSFSITVACGPVAGVDVLLHPHKPTEMKITAVIRSRISFYLKLKIDTAVPVILSL